MFASLWALFSFYLCKHMPMIFPRRITLQLWRIYTWKLLLCHFEEKINKSVLVARPLSCVPNSLLDIDMPILFVQQSIRLFFFIRQEMYVLPGFYLLILSAQYIAYSACAQMTRAEKTKMERKSLQWRQHSSSSIPVIFFQGYWSGFLKPRFLRVFLQKKKFLKPE